MSHRAFEAGLEYQMDGRVHDLRTMSDGTTIQARACWPSSRRAAQLALPYVLLTGDTRDRTAPIQRFT